MLLTTWGGVEYAWGSGVIVGLGIVTVALAAAFVAVERRVEEPAEPQPNGSHAPGSRPAAVVD